MKKILIIDDEKDLLDTLKDYFQLLGYLVYTAENGCEGLKKLKYEPDLIILDVSMPEMDGFSFCKEIRSHINEPIVFLSAKTDEDSKVEGLAVGGDDYLIKPVSLKELSYRVEAHLRREQRKTVPSKVAFFGNVAIRYDEKKVSVNNQSIPFTKTEFSIIELLSKNSATTFSKDDIYDYLWSYDKDGDSNIITEHIRRVRKKFTDVTDRKLINTVWGQGYKWIG
ncbi:response regulator transcription factor [Cytobacillus praedii]|uniref:response regulator transcription factor n=1 Tax=Cytobacillus praedii TaxID=1742358 RepID=UPI003F803419